jgi:membrane-associated phospholipid phosphatase
MTDSITKKIQEYFVSNLRAFPCTLSLYSFVAGLLFNKPAYIVFGIYTTLCDILISHPLKLLSKTIYKALKTDTIPILGRGPRPEGAKYCGCFITESNLEGTSKSFGMPSGHSITAVTTFAFWYLYFQEHTDDIKLRRRQQVILGIICASVILSRIYLGCHTVQQTIVGALIGAGLGVFGYKIIYKRALHYIDYYNMLNF